MALRAPRAITSLGLLVLVAACGAHPSAASPSESAAAAASPGTTYQPAASGPCAASGLAYAVNGRGIWHGQLTDDATITNTSNAPCSVPAAPRVTIAQSGSAPAVVDPGGETAARFDLSPHQVVELVIACDGASPLAPTAATVWLTADSSMTIAGLELPHPCTNGHLIAFQQGPGPSPTGIGALTVSVKLPPTAKAGSSLRYTVVLSNNTAVAVRLDPCPSYSEHLSEPMVSGIPREDFTYVLDCTSGAVPAEGSLSFSMAMPIPSAWQPGPVKFLWNLEVYGTPAAGGVINLV